MPPRNPRTIAEEKNNGADFASADDYDAVAGTPRGVAPQGKERDYSADPTNPPEKPAPAKNLKGE